MNYTCPFLSFSLLQQANLNSKPMPSVTLPLPFQVSQASVGRENLICSLCHQPWIFDDLVLHIWPHMFSAATDRTSVMRQDDDLDYLRQNTARHFEPQPIKLWSKRLYCFQYFLALYLVTALVWPLSAQSHNVLLWKLICKMWALFLSHSFSTCNQFYCLFRSFHAGKPYLRDFFSRFAIWNVMWMTDLAETSVIWEQIGDREWVFLWSTNNSKLMHWGTEFSSNNFLSTLLLNQEHKAWDARSI